MALIDYLFKVNLFIDFRENLKNFTNKIDSFLKMAYIYWPNFLEVGK